MELSEIRKLYVIEINLMPLAEKTKYSYRMVLEKFLSENSRCYRMSEQDLKEYFADFRTNRFSDSYYNVMCSCVKILFEKVLRQPNKMLWFKSIQSERKFKDILSYDDFVQIMKATPNLKHKTHIIISYSTGIRIGELLTIKLIDIDFANKRIFIYSEKHGKNRYVQLHPMTEKYIRAYLMKFKPKIYLFEGPNGGQYSASSIRATLNRSAKGINKNVYPHLFRHSYLSTIIEKENVFKAMDLAGHKNLKSTMIYYHTPNDQLQRMYNPLDN